MDHSADVTPVKGKGREAELGGKASDCDVDGNESLPTQ